MSFKIERCRSANCGAEVIWLRHVHTGRYAPIDAHPVPNGDVVVIEDDGTYAVLSRPAREKARKLLSDLYLQHHKTCPDRERWSKRPR